MKKVLLALILCVCSAGLTVFAATSYDNNEYQRKSRSLSRMAQEAYTEGDYDGAAQYAQEAEEYAGLSAAYIEKMLARADAEKLLLEAKTRLTWAKDMNGDKFFPDAVSSAEGYIASGDSRFAAEDYLAAQDDAQDALDALEEVREVIPLPSTYQVDLWDETKDCLWNIAKNPAIYGDPLMWEKLYEANRKNLKRPSNPNLLMPGMIVTIPSIKGEYREGMYNPDVTYEPFKNQVK